MKALVTGGAGFIGSNLVTALVERGDEVRVLDNFSTGNRANLENLDVDVVEGELRSYERVHAAVRGVEVVYHLGALGSVPRSVQDPLTSNAVNVDGTLNVLLAARDEGVRRVDLLLVVIGVRLEPRAADVRVDAAGPALSVRRRQARGRALLHQLQPRLRAFETVVLRYFNVFGPRQSPQSQYAAVVPLFIAAIEAGRAGHDPRRRRAVARLHVRRRTSSTRRCARLMRRGASGRVFNVAAGSPASVNHVAETIGVHARQAGREAPRAAAPGRHPRFLGRHLRGAGAARLRATRRPRRRARAHGRGNRCLSLTRSKSCA